MAQSTASHAHGTRGCMYQHLYVWETYAQPMHTRRLANTRLIARCNRLNTPCSALQPSCVYCMYTLRHYRYVGIILHTHHPGTTAIALINPPRAPTGDAWYPHIQYYTTHHTSAQLVTVWRLADSTHHSTMQRQLGMLWTLGQPIAECVLCLACSTYPPHHCPSLGWGRVLCRPAQSTGVG